MEFEARNLGNIFLLLKVSLSLWDTSEPWGNDYREEEVTIENREANS